MIQAAKSNAPPHPSSSYQPLTSPADIRQLLSQSKKGSTSANMHEIIYRVQKYDTHSDLSLVDRGANVGIAGNDVCVIERLNRNVDVQGIENHQLNNVPIVTAGGVTKTHRGEVIVILNQYAYTGQGTSIHSSAQIESYNNLVDDRAIKAGGN